MKTGFCEVNINPPLGIGVGGYYIPRFAKGIIDDITASALVLEVSDKRIAIISVDVCSVAAWRVEQYQKLIYEKTGIPSGNIFITATHTHTSALIIPATSFKADDDVIVEYGDFVGERIADAVLMAIDDLKPAKMGYIVGYAPERVAYIRRYKMKDGSTMTCPPKVYDKVCYVPVDSIEILRKTVVTPANYPTPEQIPLAREYKKLHEEGRDSEIPYKAMELTTVVAEALRICRSLSLFDSNKTFIDETFEKLDKKLSHTAVKSRYKIPYTTQNGQHDDKRDYIEWWTNGFWGGLMWLMYAGTGKECYKLTAERSEELMDVCFTDYVEELHHDVGFMWHILSGAKTSAPAAAAIFLAE